MFRWLFGSGKSRKANAGAAKPVREVVVFGTPLRGNGDGIGRDGDTYALPTQTREGEALPASIVEQYVREFVLYAKSTADNEPDVRFNCRGLSAGLQLTAAQIAPMFADATDNCDLPKSWLADVENVRAAKRAKIEADRAEYLAEIDAENRERAAALARARAAAGQS